ncbi:MAG TPA: ATP-binding protein [Candidatus Sulfotelmatobacter sp.]|nr:ATP-binding protein [Candidatus Sulfotelmatobacter sp.]
MCSVATHAHDPAEPNPETEREDREALAAERLAHRVAHDFNNLLFIISANLELIAEQITGDQELADPIHEACRAASRAVGLTGTLLTFARRRPLRLSVVELNRLVADTAYRLRQTAGERIAVTLAPALDPLFVTIDPSQLGDALVELAANARDAMPNGGTLVVRTVAEAAGARAVIEVRDDGAGIAPAALRRLGEPLFSTKPGARGIGLAIVRRLMRRVGGDLEIASTQGVGTTVRLVLPRGQEVVAEAAVGEAASE